MGSATFHKYKYIYLFIYLNIAHSDCVVEFSVGAQPKECFLYIHIFIIYIDSEKFEGTPNELIKYNLLLLLRLLFMYTPHMRY